MTIPLTEWVRSTGSVGNEAGCHEHHRPDPLPQHIGLWLDRCLAEVKPKDQGNGSPGEEDKKSEWGARDALYATAIESFDNTFLDQYRSFFTRWKAALTASDPRFHRRALTFTTDSRLLLHPSSNESITEGSLLLHHTYGVPYIPGSALKGAVRSRLERLALACADDTEKQELTAITQQLLGYLDNGRAQASAIDFLDALWIPPKDSSKASPLALDIVNVHHPDYYTSKNGVRQPPTDLDSPTVIHRLTVAPKSEFLCIIETRQQEGIEDWLDWLRGEILVKVGTEDGLGAATSVGYGRFNIANGANDQCHAAEATEEKEKDGWRDGELHYTPGDQELSIDLNGTRAFCGRDESPALLLSLGTNAKLWLRRARKVQVRVEPLGVGFKIIAIRKLGAIHAKEPTNGG